MKEKLKLEMKEVASNIRKVREFRNYTQDYLAAKLEISQNAYMARWKCHLLSFCGEFLFPKKRQVIPTRINFTRLSAVLLV
jgi:hypothetical protein